LPDAALDQDLRLLAIGDIGAQPAFLALAALGRHEKLQRRAGVEQPELIGVVDAMPMGDLARLQQIIDQRRMAARTVGRTVAIGLAEMPALGMRLEAELGDQRCRCVGDGTVHRCALSLGRPRFRRSDDKGRSCFNLVGPL